MWGVGGVKGEGKWRRDGTGAPEGRLGEGKGSHARRGKLGDHGEDRGSKGSVARFPCARGPLGACGDPGPDPLPTMPPSSCGS